MTSQIKSRFDQLDSELDDLFNEMSTYSEEALNKQPNTDSWSAIQTMHHMILVESATLAYLKKKMSFNPTLKKAGMGSKFREIGMWLFMRTPAKVKAPKMVSDQIPTSATLTDTQQLWLEIRKDLRAFLNELPEDVMDKEIFKHALAGKMSIKGMMIFLRDHFSRHYKQIKKAL